MAYETLLTDLQDGVMTVTLNRPDRLNAFNTAMSRADISGGSAAFQVWNDGSKPVKRDPKESITLAIFNCLKPIVAAINSTAVGVGITMCLPMDIRMMSTAGRIGFEFNKRGMAMEARRWRGNSQPAPPRRSPPRSTAG